MYLAAVLLAGALATSACAGSGNRAAPIALTDDGGRPWSLDSRRGEPTLVFFGYTHCEDTCPLTLAKLAKAMARAGDAARDVRVAFVTVDPERDSPAVLHAYLAKFGDRFVGLWGTRPQIELTERAYHVWAQKIPGKRGGDDYDDSHTSTVFFIDRGGNVSGLHDATDSIDVLSSAILEAAR